MKLFCYAVLIWGVLTVLGSLFVGKALGYDVKIDGPITAASRLDVLKLHSMVGKKEAMTPSRPNARLIKTVRILIDSPGGRADVMFEMGDAIEKLKDKGHTVSCHIVKAYSTAFYIASLCSSRTAFEDATLMWHYAWFPYMGPMSEPIARQIIESLKEDQERADLAILKTFKVTPEELEYIMVNDLIIPAPAIQEMSPGFFSKIYPNK